MATVVLSFAVTYFMNEKFYGLVVGKLPFEPVSFVASITHRGIEGDDLQQVSLLFIFMLCQWIFRAIVPKVIGTEGPRMPIEHQ